MANLVTYVKKLWKDAPSTDSPVNAVNLNHIEDGIFNNASAINALGKRADDLETDVTQINNDLTANNKKYQADYQNGKYGFTVDNEFHPFSQGTIYLGQYSANTTIDVSDLGATSVEQFVCSIDGWSSSAGSSFTAEDNIYPYVKCTVTAPSLSLANGVLTVTVGSASATGGAQSWQYLKTISSTLKTKVYFVGDIETR